MGLCFLSKRARKRSDSVPEGKGKVHKSEFKEFVSFYLDCACRLFVRLLNCLFNCVAVNDMTNVGEALQFDFRTIEEATSNFSIDNKLGEGGFGEVYKVTS